jgi:hypothetical protein
MAAAQAAVRRALLVLGIIFWVIQKMAVAGLALGAVGKEMGGRERSCTDGLGVRCTVACTGGREE